MRFWVFAAAVGVLVLDRLLKSAVRLGALDWPMRINSQYFFWIDIGQPLSQWLSLLLFAGACFVASICWKKLGQIQKKNAITPLFLFIGGSASNVIDRLFYGGAIDMIPLASISFFNIADAAILMGAALLVREIWHRKYTQELS